MRPGLLWLWLSWQLRVHAWAPQRPLPPFRRAAPLREAPARSPTAAAGERARYSLVCKLVLHPSGGEAAIADPKWGAPVRFGSAVLPS